MQWVRNVGRKCREYAHALTAGAVLGVGTAVAMAQEGGASVTLTEVVDVGAMGTAIAAIGGAVLAVAFGIGGGFRIAKKGYNWLFSKV